MKISMMMMIMTQMNRDVKDMAFSKARGKKPFKLLPQKMFFW